MDSLAKAVKDAEEAAAERACCPLALFYPPHTRPPHPPAKIGAAEKALRAALRAGLLAEFAKILSKADEQLDRADANDASIVELLKKNAERACALSQENQRLQNTKTS